MEEKYLPLGSIVMLKNASKGLMVIGYCGFDVKSKKMYDYSGCLYPEGSLGSNVNLLFNHDQIDKIISKGFTDEKWNEFIQKIKDRNKNKTYEEIYKDFLNDINTAYEKMHPEVKQTETKPDDDGTFGDF